MGGYPNTSQILPKAQQMGGFRADKNQCMHLTMSVTSFRTQMLLGSLPKSRRQKRSPLVGAMKLS